MRTITRDELQQMRNQGREPTVVNVLPGSEFEKQHIPGSLNIPVGEDDFETKVEQAAGGKDQPVVVYCASPSCDASVKAARALEKAGFSDVVEYEGGVSDWKTGGLPVASGSAS